MTIPRRFIYALGCVGQNFSYAIPLKVMESILPIMNKTENEEKIFWHVHLEPNVRGGFELSLKKGQRFNLDPYRIDLN